MLQSSLKGKSEKAIGAMLATILQAWKSVARDLRNESMLQREADRLQALHDQHAEAEAHGEFERRELEKQLRRVEQEQDNLEKQLAEARMHVQELQDQHTARTLQKMIGGNKKELMRVPFVEWVRYVEDEVLLKAEEEVEAEIAKELMAQAGNIKKLLASMMSGDSKHALTMTFIAWKDWSANNSADMIAEEQRLATAAEIQKCKMELHSKMEGIKFKMTAYAMTSLKRRAQLLAMNAWRRYLLGERQVRLEEEFGAEKAAAHGRLKAMLEDAENLAKAQRAKLLMNYVGGNNQTRIRSGFTGWRVCTLQTMREEIAQMEIDKIKLEAKAKGIMQSLESVHSESLNQEYGLMRSAIANSLYLKSTGSFPAGVDPGKEQQAEPHGKASDGPDAAGGLSAAVNKGPKPGMGPSIAMGPYGFMGPAGRGRS